jgi:hypothetical protein
MTNNKKKFMYAIAIPKHEGNTYVTANPQSQFISALRNFRYAILKEMLLRNCISAFPQSTIEVRTKNRRGTANRIFKIGFPHFRSSELQE